MAVETKRQNAGNKAPVALLNSGAAPPSPTVSLETALSAGLGARVRVTTTPPASSTYEGLLYTADPITNLIILSVPPGTSVLSASVSTTPTASNPTTSALGSTPANNFTLLPIARLASFTILSLPAPSASTSSSNSPSPASPQASMTAFSNLNPNLPQPQALDIASLHARTQTTVTHLKNLDARRGRGVTREAQDIFDGIARTYPARWLGTAMLINENVVIEPPYHVEDCRLVSSTSKDPPGGEGKETGTSGPGGALTEKSARGSAEQGLLRIRKVLGMEREKLALRRGLGTAGLGVSSVRSRGIQAGAGAGLAAGERKGG